MSPSGVDRTWNRTSVRTDVTRRCSNTSAPCDDQVAGHRMENGHRVQERLVVERDGVDVGHRDLDFGYESHGQARRSGGRVLGAHGVDTGLESART